MFFRILSLFILVGVSTASADKVQQTIDQAMAGLHVAVSDAPYSKTIARMYIGYDENGQSKVGIAHRQIKSFKPVTGLVIIHHTENGFVLHEALFPDAGKIKKAKDRQQLLTVLEQFKKVPFNPHAEKSAVDGLTGATQYGLRASGYLNYMARRVALDMETRPNWAKLK